MRVLLPLCLLFVIVDHIAADELIDFNAQIRPILSENCFHCHGPDSNNREADLRLDEREGALQAIEAGESAKSLLFQRITSDDEYEVMPPPDSNRKLTKKQIELLKKWIDQGADWGVHWSWTPLESPTVPTLPEKSLIRNPIDAFIQNKLLERQLSPSPEAEKATLLRRVTLDLTGLPPTVEELEEFLNDDTENAYEKVVDRLLASPAYGERMAWDWLDAARYADSNGYQGDRERTMWPWRDWVIDAFNNNLPYDQFTIWQLAGDLLPNATFEQKLATGFCRNHMINGEGGRIAEENRVDYVMDMTETTATLWLGLTFNCCRCHDHKFDALTQADYYSLSAFFNQTPVNGAGGNPQTPPILAAPTSEQKEKIADLEGKIAVINKEIDALAKQAKDGQANWEAEQRENLDQQRTWALMVPTELSAEHQQLESSADGTIFATGKNPDNDTYTLTFTPESPRVSAIRLDALNHPSHTKGWLARSNSGNFVLTEIEIIIKTKEGEQPVQIKRAEASFEQGNLTIDKTFDGNNRTGWAVLGDKQIGKEQAALFVFEEPVELDQDAQLKVVLRHDSVHQHHNLGRLSLSATELLEPKLDDQEGMKFRLALVTPPEIRTAEQQKLLAEKMLAEHDGYLKLITKKQSTEKNLKAVRDQTPKVMVMEDIPNKRDTFMLERGLYNAPGETVSADVPASLPEMPESFPDNRLGLAQWLVSDENPLAARVIVNRFWQQVFGIGLVKTANDFGVQGEIPEHVELLNWLAADFRDSDWDVKRLMKQLVMSHTYRQSSKVTPDLFETDPENRLLARAPRYRLPSWMLRDQALAISGLITEKRGGPSVNVYQPAGIWEEATFGKKTYKQDHGEALYRRSLYVFWRRIAGPTIFFDNASRQNCSVNTYRTNTPLHALRLFNDTGYVEAARALAERALTLKALSDQDRLQWIAKRTLARGFSEQESTILVAGLNRSRSQFQQHPPSAIEILSVGESARDKSLPVVEHAAWANLCLAILNLDETLTKE